MLRRNKLILGLVCQFAFITSFSSAQETAVQTVIADHWSWYLSQNPVFAGQLGDRSGDGKLPDVSIASQLGNGQKLRDFLATAIASRDSQLSHRTELNLEIFIRYLEDEIAENEHKAYLTPITNRWGFHIYFAELYKRLPFDDESDYESYLGRLEGFAKYANQNIELLNQGMKEGRILPAIVLQGYEETISSQIYADPSKSPLFTPFTKLPSNIDKDTSTRLAEQGAIIISQKVMPAYKKFLQFMTEVYIPGATDTVGVSALPGGREFYRHRVRKYTTLEITPEQVHEIGIGEVARIRAEMESIPRRLEFKGDFAKFLEFLRNEPEFYSTDAESYKKEVAYILKKMDGQLTKLFGKLPRTPYGIKEIPAYIAPKTTAAYYQPPSGDGKIAGFYFINTYNLKSRPLYQLEALSLHEAVPGHHLQLAIQQELEEMPEFRKYNGFTAFIEGWALYSERLGLEVGFYQDPYSDFGRLSYEMWRACRLVVDTGVHYLGWTRDQAIEYMSVNTALSRHNIVSEVDRYISWPGQALAYKMGELKIRELRKMAEDELGEEFDIREFHDVVLGDGAVPLMVLDSNVRRYLDGK
ncbi:MAG: DUF885 domain-containing protein [Planctomycetaceae bacterium]|nr:DUF885 domain-containing protein [Planctomycetaceae bacterium]